jgi:hypothetical protein
MCQICVNAHGELVEFLKQLEDKYPGTNVQGREVEKNHHVNSALFTEATVRMVEEQVTAHEKAALQQPSGSFPSQRAIGGFLQPREISD